MDPSAAAVQLELRAAPLLLPLLPLLLPPLLLLLLLDYLRHPISFLFFILLFRLLHLLLPLILVAFLFPLSSDALLGVTWSAASRGAASRASTLGGSRGTSQMRHHVFRQHVFV